MGRAAPLRGLPTTSISLGELFPPSRHCWIWRRLLVTAEGRYSEASTASGVSEGQEGMGRGGLEKGLVRAWVGGKPWA